MQEITGIFVACQTFTEHYKLWYNALNTLLKRGNHNLPQNVDNNCAF